MAVDWLKWCKGLAKKREVQILASRFKRDRREIAGRLMEFWEWCDDNLDDVDFDGEDAIVSLGDRDTARGIIDDHTGIEGMAEALGAPGVEWIDLGDGTNVRFKKFRRHNGNTAKARASENRKKALQRVNREFVPPSTGCSPGQNGGPAVAVAESNITAAPNTATPRNGRGMQGGGKNGSFLASAENLKPQKKFLDLPVPYGFVSRLDSICQILSKDEFSRFEDRPDYLDQIGFLAKLAYADASGFAWPADRDGKERSLWDFLGRAREKSNPSGWIRKVLKLDLGERYAEFDSGLPCPAHCQWLLHALHAGQRREGA